ncbi:hypothetical protein GEMRC1_014053 [Eukaryota sp. GEM-RC1]
MALLSNFNFELIHVEGENNLFADLLSRLTPAHPDLKLIPNAPFPDSDDSSSYKSETSDSYSVTMIPDDLQISPTCSITTDNSETHPWLNNLRTTQQLEMPNENVDKFWNDELKLFTNKQGQIHIPDSLRSEVLLNFHGYNPVGHDTFSNCSKALSKSGYY